MLGCLRIDGAAEPDKFLSAQRHCRRALGELDAVASGRLVETLSDHAAVVAEALPSVVLRGHDTATSLYALRPVDAATATAPAA